MNIILKYTPMYDMQENAMRKIMFCSENQKLFFIGGK